MKIALLASFTISPLKEALEKACREYDVETEIYIAPYNQCAQEILGNSSGYHKFKPDLTFLYIDSDKMFSKVKEFYKDQKSYEEAKAAIINHVNQLIEQSEGTLIFHTFEVPNQTSSGILSNTILSKKKMIKEINCEITDKDNVFFFDTDLFWKNKKMDNKMLYLADLRIPDKHIGDLINAYLGYIIPLANKTKKCLVLDLDNTLWGGVVGEEGIGKIKIGTDPEGRPFLEAQKIILELYERGVILAINSKNNEKDGLETLEKHPDILLRPKYFASIRINWRDKVTNIKEIAKEISIGLDSLVFLDDSPQERELIRKELPQVIVPEFPKNPEDIPEFIKSLPCFNTIHLTEEDLERGKMYADQRKRQDFKLQSTDLKSFIKALDIKIRFFPVTEEDIPRASQLTMKTNQFNLTTRRYDEEQMKNLLQSGHEIYGIRVADKFGDYGMTGLAILKKDEDIYIDTFLMSCRILGKRIEYAFLAVLERYAYSMGKSLIGHYIQTEKNAPCKDFYPSAKFIERNKEYWHYKGAPTEEPDIEVTYGKA